MSTLALSLFDSFRATCGGHPLELFRTRKVQALLVYLAVERSSASNQREKLMTLLWPGLPQESAQISLRQIIYHLRKIVPPAQDQNSHMLIEFLISDHQRVQINPDYPCEVDVILFKKLLQQVWDHEHAEVMNCAECAGWLREAVDLYRGDFLADFYLSDSNEFEEWVAVTREWLRRGALDALEILTETGIRQRNYRQARNFAERQLQIDDLSEGACRQLMTILALSGQRSEALRIYENCRRLLAEELGTAPTARTTALYEQILAGEVSLQEAPQAGVRGYELKEEIGSGYFGTVQRAIQTAFGREVAIKIIKPEFANHPEFIRRFEAEAQLIARLEHPNIVPLYDYWREPDRAFLVMRLLRGGSLRSALQEGPWPLEKVVGLLEQIAPALNVAHQHGLLHRDLKPANILLDEAGNAYLSDFGIGTHLDGHSARKASSPEYRSPEQILNDTLTPQTDIYSLGLVLYEALTGEMPLGQITEPDIAQRRDLPSQVDAVLQRAIARDAVDRYLDVLALAADFRDAVRVEKAGGEGFPVEMTIAGLVCANPYKGLRSFREQDAGDFFGREALVKQLVASLSRSRFLAVVGPSGSGKSSVVSAGLIPALRSGTLPGSERWFITQMTPGNHPLEALEQALLPIAVNPPPSLVEPMLKDARGLHRTIKRILPEAGAQLLLVVDQFEELYTLTRDEKQRDRFIDSLLAAIAVTGSPLRVVITLRADFYDRPLAYLPLGELLQEHTEVVLPLSPDELEQAVRRPAERAGVRLEPGLKAAITVDVGDQPGALPLLQYALTELFEARQDHTLTLKAYHDMAGIAGALGCRAEDLFETLEAHEQKFARQVFLRLVTLGEGMEDTRRRVLRSELESLGESEQPSNLENVLDLFGRHRLLTFDRDALTRGATVEVAHEALLHAWPRLHDWLEESRDDIRLQRRLAEATSEWQHAAQDEGYLLRGSRLDQFANWQKDTNVALTPDERAYLVASLDARQIRQAAEAERLVHEHRLEKRTRNVLRLLVGVLALATILALFLSNFAFGQRDLFRQESQARATAQAVNEQQAQIARSRELAFLAQLKLEGDPELGVLLALEGLRASRTVEAENALRQALHATRLQHTLYGHSGEVYWLRVSPDGRTLASTSGRYSGGSKIWDITTGRELFTILGEAITYQMDGKQLVTLDTDEGNIRIIQRSWSTETGELIAQKTIPGVKLREGFSSFMFSPDLSRVMIAYKKGRVELWDTLSGELLLDWQAYEADLYDMVFSPDGSRLATLTTSELNVWNSMTGAELFSAQTFPCCVSGGSSAAFSPNGRLLVASSKATGMAFIWDIEASIQAGEGQALFNLQGHKTTINVYAFSADGTQLATGGDDGTARVWSMEDGQLLFTLSGHQLRVSAVAFTPDGKHLVTADRAGDIRIWDLSPSGMREVSTLASAPFLDLEYAPDGSRIAAVATDGRLRVWSDLGEKLLLDIQAHEGFAYEVAFSRDGRQIATTGADNRVVVWDAESGTEQLSIQGHAQGTYAGVFLNYQSIAYSPDGKILATGGADGLVKLWDSKSGNEINLSYPMQLKPGGEGSAAVGSLVFSPDGRYLAAAGDGDKALVFDSLSGQLVLVADSDPTRMGGLAFSPDGTRLTVSHWEGALRVIDFPASIAGSSSVELFTMYPSQSLLFKTTFSPDGRYLVTAARENVVRAWDAASGEELFELTGMSDSVLGLQFSLDGKYIRAASFDGTLHKYIVNTKELIDLAYNRLTRWWRPEECSQYLHQEVCPEPQQEVMRVDYATSPAKFLGTWQTESVLEDAYLRFQEDDRLIAAQTLSSLDVASPVIETYEMVDGTLFISMPYPGCADDVGQYRLRLVYDPGQPLRLILASFQDPCILRVKRLNGSYVQVAP